MGGYKVKQDEVEFINKYAVGWAYRPLRGKYVETMCADFRERFKNRNYPPSRPMNIYYHLCAKQEEAIQAGTAKIAPLKPAPQEQFIFTDVAKMQAKTQEINELKANIEKLSNELNEYKKKYFALKDIFNYFNSEALELIDADKIK